MDSVIRDIKKYPVPEFDPIDKKQQEILVDGIFNPLLEYLLDARYDSSVTELVIKEFGNAIRYGKNKINLK